MKYKVGDKVIFLGKIWTIDEVNPAGCLWDYYIVPTWRIYYNSFGVTHSAIRPLTALDKALT